MTFRYTFKLTRGTVDHYRTIETALDPAPALLYMQRRFPNHIVEQYSEQQVKDEEDDDC